MEKEKEEMMEERGEKKGEGKPSLESETQRTKLWIEAIDHCSGENKSGCVGEGERLESP